MESDQLLEIISGFYKKLTIKSTYFQDQIDKRQEIEQIDATFTNDLQ